MMRWWPLSSASHASIRRVHDMPAGMGDGHSKGRNTWFPLLSVHDGLRPPARIVQVLPSQCSTPSTSTITFTNGSWRAKVSTSRSSSPRSAATDTVPTTLRAIAAALQ